MRTCSGRLIGLASLLAAQICFNNILPEYSWAVDLSLRQGEWWQELLNLYSAKGRKLKNCRWFGEAFKGNLKELNQQSAHTLFTIMQWNRSLQFSRTSESEMWRYACNTFWYADILHTFLCCYNWKVINGCSVNIRHSNLVSIWKMFAILNKVTTASLKQRDHM